MLKGFALIAVVLYHLNIGFDSGFLGVEVFFVISGYLMVASVMHRYETDSEFKFFPFVVGKIKRLLPLVLIVSAVSLFVGYFVMLPDDYENLAESVVASSFFANNILAAITTKNYWDIGNVYKPLMHTWYIGVLMQSYVLFAIVFFILDKIAKNDYGKFRKIVSGTLVTITGLSLLVYLLPILSSAEKFYFIPARLFEISIGGCVYLLVKQQKKCEKTAKYMKNHIYIYMRFC